MDGVTGSGLFPLQRCKTVHLVRHAQGVHNVAGEKDHSAYSSPEFFDAPITQLGWNQQNTMLGMLMDCDLMYRVFWSCMGELNTLKVDSVCWVFAVTKSGSHLCIKEVGVFGGESYSDGADLPPLMVENTGNSGRPAISSLNCPPFIAVEECRERLGVNPCDKRRSVSEYRRLFPAIDFSLMENDEDILWTANVVRERDEDVAARGVKFIDWLWTRKEKEIAIVSHSAFFLCTLRMFGGDCHPTVKEEITRYFANCELRSMVLVDRSMLGSDSSTTNYPGKIPRGIDLPSDIGDEKHLHPEKPNIN